MAWALVNHVVGQSANQNTFSTSGIDTTGADTLFALLSWYTGSGGGAVLSDSKGNTWTPMTERSDGDTGRHQLYYAKNATVGTGHTFTVTGTASFPAAAISAFSGGHLTSPLDQENFAVAVSATSGQAGSITPSEDGELLIACRTNVNSNGGTASIDSGFSETDDVNRISTGLGVSMAYLIQTTAAAANPTWSWPSLRTNVISIASFRAAAAGGGGGGNPWYYRLQERLAAERRRIFLPSLGIITRVPSCGLIVPANEPVIVRAA